MEGKQSLEKVFRALGDKHRLEILRLLKEQELTAGQLLEQVDVVQSTLSHHMKTLTDSGLVLARKRGKWTCYRLNAAAFAEACKYLRTFLEDANLLPGQEPDLLAQASDREGDGSISDVPSAAAPGFIKEERQNASFREPEKRGGEKKKSKSGKKKEKSGKDASRKKKKRSSQKST